MNKIYRTVYNTATGTWVVASELATGRRKSSKTAVAIAVAAALALPGGIARAGTNKEEDAVEQEIAMVNSAPMSAEASGAMGVMGGVSIMATGDYAAGGGVINDPPSAGNNTAIGAGSRIGSDGQGISNAVAIGGATVNNGTGAGTATGAIGIGAGATANGTNSIVIGAGASNGFSNAMAIGANSSSSGGGGTIALGIGASTTSNGALAFGTNSRTTGVRSASVGQNTGTSRADAFSVGNDVLTNADGSARTTFNRQVVNVADATQNNDAVNYGQMNRAVAAAASTKVDDTYIKVNPLATGTAATATGTGAIAIGNAAAANGAGNTAIGQGSSATSTTTIGATSLGVNSRANGDGALALGAGAATSSTVGGASNFGTAIGRSATLTDGSTGSVAMGANSAVVGANSVAIGGSDTAGQGAAARAANSVSVGSGATTTATNSVALGAGSQATAANTVSVGTTAVGGQRRIVNLAAGTADTDAVNYGQMKTELSTKVDNTYFKVNATANSAEATGANAVAVGQSVTAAGSSSVAMGSSTTASGLHGVALGAAANNSTTDNYQVAIGSAATTGAAGAIAMGRQATASAQNAMAAGLGAQATAANSVALGANSTATAADTVSVGNVTTQRRVVNMAAGTAGTDAVNVSQLAPVVSALGGGAGIDPTTGAVTGPTYNLANGTGTPAHTIGDALGQLDGALTTANGKIADNTKAIGDIRDDMNSGSIGLVQQAGAGANLTVGKNTDGTAVDFTNNKSESRTLTGVAKGTVSATSTDAINGSQLHGVSTSVADAIGAGSTVNPDGSITAPSFTVGDGKGGKTTVHNVGDVVDNLDGRVTGNETAITNIRNEMNSGTIGLVQQASAGQKLTVGANTDGTEVDLTGTAGARKLTGVGNGAVSATSTEAINGSQLHGVSSSVADAIGAGSTVNPDGSITAPSFTVGDGSGGTKTVHNVGDVVGNLDGRMTTAEGNITNIRNEMNSGTIGLVQQNPTTGVITVAAGSGGSVVNFAGMGGTTRVLTGLSNGVVAAGSTDAVTGDQLHTVKTDLENKMDAGLGDLEKRADKLDDRTTDLERRTGDLEGSVGDLEGQVGAIKDNLGDLTDLDGRVKNLEDSSGTGENSTVVGKGADASGKNSSAIGNGSVASGENSSAIGQGAVASGNNSSAVGQGAKAEHNNSVALGTGSVTDRDNSVSVGSAGAERQITNVAAGTAPTDAVNVQQMNNAVHSARQDAMGGVAAAMAIAGLPQSSLPGKTFMAISGSTYGNEYGTAIGASYMTKDGKWVVKGAVNTSSRGEVGAVVGGGFYW